MTVLAVSPHLDDAAFSAGGTLATLARRGSVVVASVFTASVADPRGFALACQLDKGLGPGVDYMALRRAEDRAACAALGAEPLHLPFREAPHRGYDSTAALFAAIRPDDRVDEELAPALQALVDALAPDLILAPQAIGAHVDHVQVVRALDRLALPAPVLWWRDYPYTVRSDTPKQPWAARFGGLAEIAAPLDAAAADAKRRACEAYVSQLGFQFGGVGALRRRLAEAPPEELRGDPGGASALASLRR